jgi:hypothetical protein
MFFVIVKDGVVVQSSQVFSSEKTDEDIRSELENASGAVCVMSEVDVLAGSTWDGSTFTPPEPAAEVASRTVTKLQYMNRFTDVELATIYTAAKTVIQVEIWLEKFKLASDVNLDDPATLAGLQAMEAFGLIGPGRAAEIAA